MSRLREKENAIKLRKRGLSYREILDKIPVAKSTLSLWLKSVGLSKKQKQRLTEKKLMSAKRGALSRKNARIALTEAIKAKARKEIGLVSKKNLWLIGIALYWAEGSKQKEHLVSQQVKFSNSDPRMIKVFLDWLSKICKISSQDFTFEVYIHETANINEAKKYWAGIINFPENRFTIRLKKNKFSTFRKNKGKDYHGLLNVRVKKSTNLNRKIEGWIEGICNNSGVV